jgi:ribosomal protein L16/L10AE
MEVRQGRVEKRYSSTDEKFSRKLSMGIEQRVKMYEDQIEECKNLLNKMIK